MVQTQPNSLRGRLVPGWLSHEWVFLVVMVGLACTRLLWLDADANLFKRTGDIGDEGWFWNAARNRVLFGEYLVPEDANGFGMWVAPLVTGMDSLLFRAAGPSFYTGRLPSALSGLLLLCMVYFIARKDYGRRAGIAAVLLLGLNVHFYNYNRLGLVESLRLLLILAALWVWLADTKRPYATAALSGLIMAGAMLSKVRPDFVFYPAALWLLDWLRGRLNWKRIIVFAAPLSIIALELGLYIVTHLSQLADSIIYLLQNNAVTQWSVPSYIPFLPFAVLTNPVLRLFPVFVLYLLAWPVLAADLGAVFEAPKQFLQSLRQADILCLTLLIGALLCGFVYDFGDRRMFPLVIPLTLFAARQFAQPALSLAAPHFAASRRLTAGLLAATGVLWLSWWKSIASNPWPDGSVRWWLSWAVAVAAVGAGLAALHFVFRTEGKGNARVLVAALALTHLFILTDLSTAQLAQQVLNMSLPWWAELLLALAVSLAFLTVYFLKIGARQQAAWRLALGGAVAAFGALVIGGQLIQPSFSNRDAARAVSQFVRPGEVILGWPVYDTCIETQARCVVWTADAARDEWRFNRDQTSFSRRKFWWVSREEAEKYYNPAISPCAYDSAGVVLGALTPIASYQVSRGPEDWNMELFRVDNPLEHGCPSHQDE